MRWIIYCVLCVCVCGCQRSAPDSSGAQAHVALAMYMIQAHHLSEAAHMLSYAVEEDPSRPAVWQAWGAYHAAVGDWHAVQTDYRHALHCAKSQTSMVWSDYGVLLCRHQRWDTAWAALSSAQNTATTRWEKQSAQNNRQWCEQQSLWLIGKNSLSSGPVKKAIQKNLSVFKRERKRCR